MPIKVRIMVIEKVMLCPNVTKPQKGITCGDPCGLRGWILCEPRIRPVGISTSNFSGRVWPRTWGVFRLYMMHAELVLLIENSYERLLRVLEHGKVTIPFKYPANSSLFQLELALLNLHGLTYCHLSCLINKPIWVVRYDSTIDSAVQVPLPVSRLLSLYRKSVRGDAR